tara:strand:- start:2015 stop:3418 length:1404 start_codon:yes stop_codon:yes gene_type:complete
MNFAASAEEYRSFSKLDTKNFSRLSGDYNPIHIDQVYARKTITGTCVVHGMHNLLWVLELVANKDSGFFKEINAQFINPVFVDCEVKYRWEPKTNFFTMYSGGEKVAVVYFDMLVKNFNKEDSHGLEIKKLLNKPTNLNPKDVSEKSSLNPYYSGESHLADSMFPCLSKKIGKGLVCQIASLSEVVGMQVPGLHSLFSSVEIKIKRNIGIPKIYINSFNKRYQMVKLGCQYKDLDAKLEAVFRPPPVEIPSCKNIKTILKTEDFSKVKALIVGGSRGLGAWVAKILALGGAKVTITYNLGKRDAEEIQEDIIKSGGHCRVLKITIKKSFQSNIPDYDFNQMFYFASSRIAQNKNRNFDNSMYKEFYSIYVQGFVKLIEQSIQKNVKCVFYPSTVFIDESNQMFQEYMKAKLEGELFCKKINKENQIKILHPRLPKMLTDQTASLISSGYSDVSKTIVPYLIKMRDLS